MMRRVAERSHEAESLNTFTSHVERRKERGKSAYQVVCIERECIKMKSYLSRLFHLNQQDTAVVLVALPSLVSQR